MRHIFLFLFSILILFSCKREKTTWDVDFLGPVAYAEYSITDILPDTIVTENDENFLSISFNQEIINLKPDNLIAIEDTTLSNGYTLPSTVTGFPLSQGFAFPLAPGSLNLDPGGDVELKEGIVCTGNLNISLINPLATSLVVTYGLNDITLDGESFSFVDTLAPAVNNIPSIKFLSFDIANYEMNLSADGTMNNVLDQSLSFVNSLQGDSVLVTQFDTLKFDFEIADLTLSYAKGYFGSFEINETETFNLDNLLGLESNSLVLEEASMALKISNGIGVDFRLSNTNYSAINTNSALQLNLENEELNQSLNIDRAIDLGSEPAYSTKEIFLDENNSNLLDIVTLAPDSFDVMFSLEVNPLGNSSSSNDFIYKTDGIKINAELDIPLCFSVTDLQIQDTLSFDFEVNENATIQEGRLTLYIENSLPFDVELDLAIYDESNNAISILSENQLISSCEYINDICTGVKSEISYILSEENVMALREEGQLLVTGTFSSSGKVKINAEQHIKFQAVIDAIIVTGL